ncbi:MAG: molybdopterin cofactor-binding domain-containing protein [Bacillota bacterium]
MKKKGRGMAVMYYPVGPTGKPNPSGTFLKVNHDGTVIAQIGAVDKGQGLITVITQIIAEELGVRFEDIRIITADTELSPYDYGIGASRGTYWVGNAVRKAAVVAKAMLFDAAAIKLDLANGDNLIAADGMIYWDGFPAVKLSISDAAWYSERELGKPVIAAASFTPALKGLSPETGQGRPYAIHNYATQIAEVKVDTETGEVDVLKVIAVHDCGKAINPMLLEGQIEGGIVMGLGYALMEELLEDQETGGVINDSFVDYAIPTASDIPKEFVIDLIEDYEEKGPFGAKGVAEPTQLPTAPAITNAIFDAIGVRIYDLPVTPAKILRALKEKESL